MTFTDRKEECLSGQRSEGEGLAGAVTAQGLPHLSSYEQLATCDLLVHLLGLLRLSCLL